MPDYAKLALTAQRLIEGAGRTLTLQKRATTPANASQPWRGPENDPEVPAATATLKGVILDYKLTADTSDFVRRGYKRCLVAALSTGENLREFTVLLDGADRWEINECKLLIPGAVGLLWQLQLRR